MQRSTARCGVPSRGVRMQPIKLLVAALATACVLAACAVAPTGKGSANGKRLPVPTGGQRLTDDAVLLPGAFVLGRQPDGNSVLFAAPQGLVVVDTGRHPAHSQAILDTAARAQRPIVAVVNSHWHLDHVGGNPRLRAKHPGLAVYASPAIEAAMGDFLKTYRGQLVQALAASKDAAEQADFRAEMALIDSGRALYPDQRITAPGDRT